MIFKFYYYFPSLSLNFCEFAGDCCKPMRATDACECSIMAQSLSHSLKDCLNCLVYYCPRKAKGFCQHLGEGITASLLDSCYGLTPLFIWICMLMTGNGLEMKRPER